MSIYEAELRRRLASGEDIEATAKWFIERMATDEREAGQLSEFELEFFKRVHHSFLPWRRRKMN
jgi:hypothetical protein